MTSHSMHPEMFAMVLNQTVPNCAQVNLEPTLANDNATRCKAKGDCNQKYAKIQDGLESSISYDGRTRITRILSEIQCLTDVEKLLLYLKLPTGLVQEDPTRLTPPSCLPTTSNRREQAEAVTWIKSHLEEYGEVCMPKAEVYDEYRQYCEHHELRPLCNADFGKMMKHVFPDINTRRLGQRGQSKYFYGGLRKKTEHAPPTLSELEVHSKVIEIDSNLIDNEIFKASCQLVCEWADKLLDSKFSSIQAVAENLIKNMYVNTKSVAAFTLIASMQDLKGSALVSSQPAVGGDKHKETNLLLQQKLHKNKVLQKQKEKLQALKDDTEQQQTSSTTTPSLDCRTPSTPSRKSTTPSRMSKTPRLPSPSPSPLPLQSPRKFEPQPSPLPLQSPSKFKFQYPQKHDPNTKDLFVLPVSLPVSVNSDNSVFKPTAQTSSDSQKTNVKKVDGDLRLKGEVNYKGAERRSYSMVVKNVSEAEKEHFEMAENKKQTATSENESGNNIQTIVIDADYEMGSPKTVASNQLQYPTKSSNEMEDPNIVPNESGYPKIASNEIEELVFNEAETPVSEMETDHMSTSHVRKINFEDLLESKSQPDIKLSEKSSLKSENEQKKRSGVKMKANKEVKSSTELSKSEGHLSLKMLLEKKGDHQTILNKSVGFLEKSKNALFMNQSNGRLGSAFVPVPSRKDNVNVNQSTSTGIPIGIPSSTQTQVNQSDVFAFESMSQPTNITMIAVPSSIANNQMNFTPTSQRLPDNIIKILPGSSTVHQASKRVIEAKDDLTKAFIPSTLSESRTNAIVTSVKSLPTETLTVAMVTMSSAVCSSSNDAVMSSAQISPNISRHSKAPRLILPRPSPNKKESPVKENKGDNPVYDKRPVSVILKEKRAKEEALAKLATKLPTIPFQPSISLNRNQLGTLQGMQTVSSSVPPKEVVIIVNKQPRTVLNPTLIGNTGMATGNTKIEDYLLKNLSKNTACIKESDVSIDLTTDNKSLNSTKVTVEVPASHFENELKLITTKNAEDSLHTPGDITPVLCETAEEREITPLLNEMDVDEMDVQKTFVPPTFAETSCVDKLEILNITSPIRPDSTCSLGYETPSKLVRLSDACSSRPESACSYGRETPSGARKRKSSDFHPRRDIKRLNSTGDEGEDLFLKDVTAVLSPDNDLQVIVNPRRAQSCFELDKDTKHGQQNKPYTCIMIKGLQSPDISYLEEEVLREAYNFEIPPQKLPKLQRNSVGVGDGSRKHSQQKLIKQQEYLEQRVNKFLQKEAPLQKEAELSRNEIRCAGEFVESGNEMTLFEKELLNIGKDDPDKFITKDSVASGKDSGKNSQRIEQHLMQKKESLDMEPSGLPGFIADFINENMEKRQSKNQSVMSEPDLHTPDSQPNFTSDLSIPNFRFEVDHGVSNLKNEANRKSISIPVRSASQNDNIIVDTSQKKPLRLEENNTFTVPKVPTFSSRGKDSKLVVSTDTQRCQSLPTFTSPIQSPISPVALPLGRRNIYQRATSMSPRSQHTDVQSDTGASLKTRIEVRENHPISVNIHPGVKCRDDSFLKHPANFVVRQNLADESRNPNGTYLQSIQHNLQMPRESFIELQQHDMKSADMLGEKTTQYSNTGSSYQQTFNQEVAVDGTLQSAEVIISQTPFSDSGYHSTGPSPILNSTPVSSNSELDPPSHSQTMYQQAVPEPHPIMTTEFTSPIPRLSPQQSPNQLSTMRPPQNPAFVPRMRYDSGIHTSPLNSSTNSAFIPIQGSHQDIRYVTPIRPTVTLPSSGNPSSAISEVSGISSNLYIDPNPVSVSEDIMMISPKTQDPPSYETAIMSLRKPGNVKEDINQQSDMIMLVNENVGQINDYPKGQISFQKKTYSNQGERANVETNSEMQERVSLLANMGKPLKNLNSHNEENFGPFASKLVQLSRQTKQVSPKKATSSMKQGLLPGCFTVTDGSQGSSHKAIKAALEGPHSGHATKSYRGTNQSLLPYIPANCISQDLKEIQSSGDKLHSGFQTNQSGNLNIQDDFLQSDGAITSSAILQNEQTLQAVSINTDYLHSASSMPSQENVLNLDPSFQLSPHSIGQNISQSVLTSNHPEADNSTIISSSHLNERNARANELSQLNNVFNKGESLEQMDFISGQRGSELADEINLTWETLREIEGQYLSEDAVGLYRTGQDQNQPLSEFDMFQE